MVDLDYKKVLLRLPEWSRDEFILVLRKAAASKRSFDSNGFLALAARRELGSLRTALATAGLDPNAIGLVAAGTWRLARQQVGAAQ